MDKLALLFAIFAFLFFVSSRFVSAEALSAFVQQNSKQQADVAIVCSNTSFQ